MTKCDGCLFIILLFILWVVIAYLAWPRDLTREAMEEAIKANAREERENNDLFKSSFP